MQPSIDDGTLIGERWRVTSLLGQGGFGQVFHCEDESSIGLGTAAVKVLHPNTSPQERAEFLDEVKKIATLRHPNLVGYLDSGVHTIDGVSHPYLVTELCEGSLADLLGQLPGGRMDATAASAALTDIGAGLAHLHARGLIHRDIKPGNVLFGGGNWKLADFGLMRDLTATGSYHRGDSITGTPLYMAPELFVTMTATAPSDVYALGVVAHVMLTGRTVHTGSGPALIHAITSGPPAVDPSVPPAVAALISSAVDPDVANRLTAQEFHDRLQGTFDGWAPPASSPAPPAAPTAHASQPLLPPAEVDQRTTITGPPSPSDVPFEPPVVSPAPVAPPPSPGFQPPINAPGGLQTARTSRAVPIVILLVVAGFVGLIALGAAILMFSQPGGEGVVSVEADSSAGDGPLDEPVDIDDGDESGADDGSGAGDGVDIGEGVDIGDDVTIGDDEDPVIDSQPAGVVDPEGHMADQPCANGLAGQLLVTNNHTAPVNYVVEVAHFDASGVRIDETRDTVQALDPGLRASLGIGSVEDGAASCELSSFVVTPTDAILIEQREFAAIESCEADGGWHRIVLTATNPLARTATAEVYVAVVDETGLRIDEDWAGATIYDIDQGQTARTEESEVFWNLDAVGQPMVECVVIAVEFD